MLRDGRRIRCWKDEMTTVKHAKHAKWLALPSLVLDRVHSLLENPLNRYMKALDGLCTTPHRNHGGGEMFVVWHKSES